MLEIIKTHRGQFFFFYFFYSLTKSVSLCVNSFPRNFFIDPEYKILLGNLPFLSPFVVIINCHPRHSEP